MPIPRTTSDRTSASARSNFVQPMITSLFGLGRASAASKNGAHNKQSSKEVHAKEAANVKSKKRKIRADKTNVQDPDKTLVGFDVSTLQPLAPGQRAYTTPLPAAKRRRLDEGGEDAEVSPMSAAGDTTLVVTPGSVWDKGAFDTPGGTSAKPKPWMELEKAWEGQRRGSASSLLPSETLSQTSLGSFGFSVPQHISTPSKNPFRAHVFSVAFEDEDDLDFDLDGSTLPSQGSAVAVRLGGLAKPTIHPPRSPSPLSPSNPTASHTAPLSRLPTSRLIIPSRNVSIVPSSQTQPLSPLSPPLRSNVIIPSSQTQPISSLSPVSSRTSNIIPSSQTQAIQPLSPCSQSQLSRFQASPRTMTRALIPSSQAMENIDLLAATELDGSPVLDHIILPPVDQTHSTNPTAPIQPKATQSLSRHPSSETSYYGDSVAFTMPPSIPDSALLMSGSEPDRACEITHELVDSSLAQKLFKRLDTDPAMIDPAFLDSELADTGPPAIQSDPAAMIEKSAPAPGHAPVFTRPDENATIGFTMPPSIPTDSLAVNLADYLPLLDT